MVVGSGSYIRDWVMTTLLLLMRWLRLIRLTLAPLSLSTVYRFTVRKRLYGSHGPVKLKNEVLGGPRRQVPCPKSHSGGPGGVGHPEGPNWEGTEHQQSR